MVFGVAPPSVNKPRSVNKRSIPAPPVCPGEPHTAFEQIQGGLPAHPASRVHVFGPAVAPAGAGIDQDDLQRRQCVADAGKLAFDVIGGDDIAVVEMARDHAVPTPLLDAAIVVIEIHNGRCDTSRP